MPKAIGLGYPPGFLYLGAIMHRAARVLKAEGTFSEPLVVTRSILAGCTQSVDWTRAFLYDLLDQVHKDHRPVQVRSFVDDLALRVQGVKGAVVQRAVSAAGALLKGLEDRGAKVSREKTVVMASSRQLEKQVQEGLAGEGFQIQTATTARDLGGDAQVRGRRRIPVARGRVIKSSKRTGRIAHLARKKREAAKLIWTGAKPQATWGHQIKGMAPSTVRTLRGKWAQASGERKGGGCTTVTYEIAIGRERDPAIKIPMEMVKTCLDVYREI